MIQPIIPSPLSLPIDPSPPQWSAERTSPTIPLPPSEAARRSSTDTRHALHNEQNNAGTASLEKTLEQLNDSMQAWATGMRFDVDEDAQRVVVSIIDSTTGEVLRTVPSESVIRVARMIVQLQGVIVNTQA